MKSFFLYNDNPVLKAVFLVCLIVFTGSAHVNAGITGPIQWQQLPTEKAVIYYQSMDDLSRFDSLIKFSRSGPGQSVMEGSKSDSGLPHALSKKIDALFVKSQELLEMNGFTNKINVRLFKNKQQLDHAFYAIYKKKCTARAWYTHETLTVYIQLDDLHEGMLAHEFAHAIIDHYMIIPPPGKAAEILARYVDTHLHGHNADSRNAQQVEGYSSK